MQTAAPGFPTATLAASRCAASAAAGSSHAARDKLSELLEKQVAGMKSAGTYKRELVMTTAQSAQVGLASTDKPVYNFCANNYLGLSNDPDLIAAAASAMKTHGLGLSSVRFICGTQDLHKRLEDLITKFYGTEDTILFPSAFDANAGLFEAILTEEDAVISDELNHASIIDGIRLCKAERHRYKHMNLEDLERILKATQVR